MQLAVPEGPTLHYEVIGDGPPVLMIAGTGCDHLWWAPQAATFSRHHTVITCDMRGAGASTVYPDRAAYSAGAMADDAAHLIEHLGLGPVHVMGHSLGSCIVQELALRRPELVASAQLHATWGHADEWLRRAFVGTMEYLVGRGDAQFAWRTVSMWIFSPRYLAERSPAHVRETVSGAFITNPNLDAGDGLLGHLHADGLHDTRGRLSELAAPTLVTAGELDVCIPARYGEAVVAELPRARWHMFRGERSAHAYTMEMAEEFDHVSMGFIADHA
jgi:pimeloyl-ACP methyl ester carboxylesterase